MRIRHFASAFAVATLLFACGGGESGIPGMPTQTIAGHGSSPTTVTRQSTLSGIPAVAPSVTIIEYSVPTNFIPAGGLTVTPDGAVWWDAYFKYGTPYNLVRMQGSSVTTVPVAPVAPPLTNPPYLSSTSGAPSGVMASTRNGRVWDDVSAVTTLAYPSWNDYVVYAQEGYAQTEPSGGFLTYLDTGVDGGAPGLTVGADGNVWFVDHPNGLDNRSAFGYISPNATDASSGVHLLGASNTTLWSSLASGPDAKMWLVGTGPPDYAERFYRYEDDGYLAGTIALPARVGAIVDAVAGPDRAMWFTTADNLIGRITISGSLTTYAVPTANASLSGITVGGDGALWFVEEMGNKIGRITTTGQIIEYALPTPNSQPIAIVGPGSSSCGPSQLWVIEYRNGNSKIAELLIKI